MYKSDTLYKSEPLKPSKKLTIQTGQVTFSSFHPKYCFVLVKPLTFDKRKKIIVDLFFVLLSFHRVSNLWIRLSAYLVWDRAKRLFIFFRNRRLTLSFSRLNNKSREKPERLKILKGYKYLHNFVFHINSEKKLFNFHLI